MVIIPDSKWYRDKSTELDVSFSCPYANVHKCPRYYASIYMLGEVNMITSIEKEKKLELDTLWKESGIQAIIAEEDTGIAGSDNKWSSFSNFCPEVSFTYLNYYASYLSKYADEIDKDSRSRIAERDNLDNDWRYEWSHVSACHFSDCSAYNQVKEFNDKGIGKLDHIAHSNIVTLVTRMEQCLDVNDPSGVLHAASNILETLAKDIINNDKIKNKTLGSFIGQFNKESNLPSNIKSVVENIYKLRNTMPLSGHGSTNPPDINLHDAIVISATTKFIVEVEYRSRKI